MGALREKAGRWLVKMGLRLLGQFPKGAELISAERVEEPDDEDEELPVIVAPLTEEARSMLVLSDATPSPVVIESQSPAGSLQDRMARARREMGDR